MVRPAANDVNFKIFIPRHLKLLSVPMFRAFHLLLLATALSGLAAADLPRKAPLTKYSSLWTDSPFTSKPPPPEQVAAANPLEDYALAGVSPIPDGYQVTLLNRKDPKERITVRTGKPSEGFKILDVNRKPGDPLGTVVRMSSGNVTGTVAFDESLLTLEAPPPPKPAQPQLPPGIRPGTQPQPGQAAPRQPRPRVVPPPNPQARQGQPQTRQPAVQRGNRTPAQNQQRPSRRGR